MAATATRPARFAGWPVVGWCALILIVLMTTLVAVFGTNERGIRVVIRSSAQTSLVLFLSAFSASALSLLWPTPLTRWMLRNRRYLGVSFAVSHFIHLLAIIALVRVAPDVTIGATTLVGGGLAYVFIAAMTATSFDVTADWLGRRAWTRLHTAGAYYIWFIFFISYAPRAAMQSILYAPFAFVLLAALGLRFGARGRRRSITVPVRTTSGVCR